MTDTELAGVYLAALACAVVSVASFTYVAMHTRSHRAAVVCSALAGIAGAVGCAIVILGTRS